MEFPEDVKSKLMSFTIEKHPKSICIANYKGGVGKTTVTTLLGYFLAYKGYKVLMFDIDPQCSLSLAVGFDPAKVEKTDFTIYNLVTPKNWSTIPKIKFLQYVDNVPDIHAPETLKIIKGSFEVDELDRVIIEAVYEKETAQFNLFNYCRNMINAFHEFDYVLVDCPPNKMYLTQAMLRACSYYLTVTIPDKISGYGMPRLLKWVKKIPKSERPKLLGCVLNTVVRSGGNEFGTSNQQFASAKLNNDIILDLEVYEKTVIGNSPIISHIPRLDVISKFLSQEDEKVAWFDFKKQNSDQKSVHTIMMNFVKRIENRIEEYAKA
jgi:cellulose biosynthesis protein BcsQ